MKLPLRVLLESPRFLQMGREAVSVLEPVAFPGRPMNRTIIVIQLVSDGTRINRVPTGDGPFDRPGNARLRAEELQTIATREGRPNGFMAAETLHCPNCNRVHYVSLRTRGNQFVYCDCGKEFAAKEGRA